MRRRREHGGIAIMAAILTVVLVVLGLGGATLGRVVATKADARRASDAASLAAAEILRDKGRGNLQPATLLGNANFAQRRPGWRGLTVDERSDLISVTAEPSMTIFTPSFVFDVDAVSVRAQSKAFVREAVFKGFQNKDLRIALVLDFSGSMGGERMAMLKKAVREEAVGSRLQVEWAAVLYDSSIMGKAKFKKDNDEAKKEILDLITKNDARGGTSTGMAMKEAKQLLTGEGDPEAFTRPVASSGGIPLQWMLVISDGPPSDPDLAIQTAHDMTEKGYGVMSLDVSGGEMDFMKQIAGIPGPNGFPDPRWALAATDAEKLQEKFQTLLAMATCPPSTLTEVDSKPKAACQPTKRDNCQRIGGFLRWPGGGEQPIPESGSAWLKEPAFEYNATAGSVGLNYQACLERAVPNRAEFVVRYNRARLMQ